VAIRGPLVFARTPGCSSKGEGGKVRKGTGRIHDEKAHAVADQVLAGEPKSRPQPVQWSRGRRLKVPDYFLRHSNT